MAFAQHASVCSMYGLPDNFCMPELVPDFEFHGRPQHQLLVEWLDALCATGRGAMPSSFLEDPAELSVEALVSEYDASTQHELVCAKCVTGWLLQRIRSECDPIPPKLLSGDAALSKRLGGSIGGCANVCWIYNWCHPSLQPGTEYDYKVLIQMFDANDRRLRPRFLPIGGEVGTSFAPFIMVHIEMEVKANAMVESAVKAQDLIASGHQAKAEMAQVASQGRAMLDVFTACFNDGRVNKEHWGAMQHTLKFPEYSGMSSAQNISVQLLGEVVGVGAPGHAYNQNLHDIAEKGFMPHQRRVLKFVRGRRDILREHANSAQASKEELASYNFLVRISVMWRGSHAKQVVKYVAAALEEYGGKYRTSTGHEWDMQSLGEIFESRMQDFSNLQLRSRL